MMFDRDVTERIIQNEYERGDNMVYRFNIPIPQHRKAKDKISIEHYLTDDDLATFDSDGKRMFLAKDFDFKGISLDQKYLYKHAKAPTDKQYNPLEIINGSEGKRVYGIRAGDEINYAMSKDDFVNHIINGDEGFQFDLSAYKLILDVLCKIVSDADAQR